MFPQGTSPPETVSSVMDELKTSIQLNKVITVDRILRLESLMKQETFQLVAEILQVEEKIKDFKDQMLVDDQLIQELEEARNQNEQHQMKIQTWVQEWNEMKQQIEEKQKLANSLMENSEDEVSTTQEIP